MSCISPEWVNKQSDVLVKLLAEIVACAFYMTDLAGGLEKLIGAERGLERAVSFTGFGPQLFNVLGHSPKVHLSNWISPSSEEHELTRSEEWDLSERQALVSPKPPLPSDSGPSPSELPPAPRHDQWETINPIREQLWREARWNAMLLLWGNSQDVLPILALGFENHLPAEAIFRQWREQFGHEDHEGRLRISVIRGFSRSHPHWYRIVIGANPEAWIRRRGVSRVMMASRVHEMTPATGDNLDNFLRKYAESGSYLLSFATPADLASSNGQRAIQRRAIRKSGLIVRHAWEVGLNDFDVVAIHADDDPVLPESTVEAPVTEVLVRKRSKTDA